MEKDLLSMLDLDKNGIFNILELAEKMKKSPEDYSNTLLGKTLVMIFEKPSTRTRLSFEIAMTQLGGHGIFFSTDSHFLATGEDLFDTAKVISGYADFLMARVNSHETLEKFAMHCSIPTLNGLSDLEHPFQALADLMTIKEVKGLKDVKVAYVGDGYNVCNSLILACAMVGIKISVGCPRGYGPKIEIPNSLESYIEIMKNPVEAVKDSDVIYTDTWISMGLEEEKEKRIALFSSYQVNSTLMQHAKKDAVFMHCLPAHKGMEVTKEVIEGSQSVVFQQAENRLHTEKAVLYMLSSKV